MNTILWSQGVSETDPGYFVIDGVSSRYSNANSVQEEALVLMNTSRFETLMKHHDGNDTSPSFVVKRNNEWLYFEGNFNETDNAERLRVFRFMTNLKLPNKVIQTLTEYAQKMNCTVRDEDIDQIRFVLELYYSSTSTSTSTFIHDNELLQDDNEYISYRLSSNRKKQLQKRKESVSYRSPYILEEQLQKGKESVFYQSPSNRKKQFQKGKESVSYRTRYTIEEQPHEHIRSFSNRTKPSQKEKELISYQSPSHNNNAHQEDSYFKYSRSSSILTILIAVVIMAILVLVICLF